VLTSVGVFFMEKKSQCKQFTAIAFPCTESKSDSLEEVGIGLVGPRDVNLQ